jgi:hypothetical protein
MQHQPTSETLVGHHWHRHHRPPADNTESYISSSNHQKHQKDSFLYPSTLPPRHGFVTHRRTHMRACSLHRCAHMRTCSLHKCTCVRTYSLHRCALVRTYFLHRHTPPHTCSPYRCAQVRACSTHRLAPVRACSTHRRALRARLKLPLSCPHVRISDGQTHTYACLLPDRPCMWGPYPLNVSVWPPIQPLPKK